MLKKALSSLTGAVARRPYSQRRAESLWKLYPVTPTMVFPTNVEAPSYIRNDKPTIKSDKIEYKSAADVALMREACQYASYIREFAGKQVAVGITTDEIDKRVFKECVRLGIYPSPLGYCGFPKTVCTSVNNVVCHGIPDLRPLEEGDIVNIDVSTFKNGFHGDCSGMFVAGTASAADTALINATKLALDRAIAVCGPGVPLTAIGDAIQPVADAGGYGVVETFTGHGIGKEFHMAPYIFHHRNGYPGVMRPGMVFTIEPIFNASRDIQCVQLDDGWTIITSDGARSAQFEQTLVITDTGVEVMTQHEHVREKFA